MNSFPEPEALADFALRGSASASGSVVVSSLPLTLIQHVTLDLLYRSGRRLTAALHFSSELR